MRSEAKNGELWRKERNMALPRLELLASPEQILLLLLSCLYLPRRSRSRNPLEISLSLFTSLFSNHLLP